MDWEALARLAACSRVVREGGAKTKTKTLVQDRPGLAQVRASAALYCGVVPAAWLPATSAHGRARLRVRLPLP